jgi:hypothetical protein
MHQIGKPPFGAAAHQRAIMQGADPGAVIAAIFHPLQAIDQPVGDAAIAHDPDDAAHCPGSSLHCLFCRSNRAHLNGKPPEAAPLRDFLSHPSLAGHKPRTHQKLRKKTTFPSYSPFFETHPSHHCGELRRQIVSLGGWK